MKQELEQLIGAVVHKTYAQVVAVELTRPDEQFGDYATNVALQLTKVVGIPPREIAESIGVELRGHEYVADVSVAGPGFLNITLTDVALAEALTVKPEQLYAGKTVLIEYSDPNPFKPLHAGHLYTTLVGDVIARLVEHAGAKTIRLNFGGDVGLHAAKSMWAIVAHLGGEYPEKMGDIPEAERPAWLGARYVEGNNAYEDDEQAKQAIIECNRWIYQLHVDDDYDSPLPSSIGWGDSGATTILRCFTNSLPWCHLIDLSPRVK
jgi:arginyl-tRNA synthetase